MKPYRLIASLILLAMLLPGATTSVSGQTGYRLAAWVVAGGGNRLQAGNYILSGTAGQPGTSVLAAASYQFYGGFWNPSSPLPVNKTKVYLPVVIH